MERRELVRGAAWLILAISSRVVALLTLDRVLPWADDWRWLDGVAVLVILGWVRRRLVGRALRQTIPPESRDVLPRPQPRLLARTTLGLTTALGIIWVLARAPEISPLAHSALLVVPTVQLAWSITRAVRVDRHLLSLSVVRLEVASWLLWPMAYLAALGGWGWLIVTTGLIASLTLVLLRGDLRAAAASHRVRSTPPPAPRLRVSDRGERPTPKQSTTPETLLDLAEALPSAGTCTSVDRRLLQLGIRSHTRVGNARSADRASLARRCLRTQPRTKPPESSPT